MSGLEQKISDLKKELDITIVAHYYQKDEVVAVADYTGDSLELAKISANDPKPNLLFCGVAFMGQSAKILAPNKRVFMPRLACCSMARMIDSHFFDNSVDLMVKAGVARENILPITYINSSAEVKAKVGAMGGSVCTSSNARKIMERAVKSGKKILFVPDRCLGQNLAKEMGLKSAVLGKDLDLIGADVICFDGFCSVHQLFLPQDVEFYRKKYPDILVAVHPECDPSVVALADFVGSTSQIIKWVKEQPIEQKIAVGTEFNLVNRLRDKNTFVLSSTKPECPTMNETTLEEVYETLIGIKNGKIDKEILLDPNTIDSARIALERMFEVS